MNETIKKKAIEFDQFSSGLAKDMSKFLKLANEFLAEGEEFAEPLTCEEYKDTEEAAYIHLVFSNLFAMYMTSSSFTERLERTFRTTFEDYAGV